MNKEELEQLLCIYKDALNFATKDLARILTGEMPFRVNNDIAILQDYLSSEELDDQDIEEINDTLQELYTIRQKAAKDKTIRSRYDSLINVTYPDIKDYNY